MMMRRAVPAFLLCVALPCLLPAGGDPPSQPPAALAPKDDAAQHGARARRMFTDLLAGKFEYVHSQLGPDANKALPDTRLQQTTSALLSSCGKVTAIGDPIIENGAGGGVTVYVPIQFEKAILEGSTTFLPSLEDKAASFWIRQPVPHGVAAAPVKVPYIDATKYQETDVKVGDLPGKLCMPVGANQDSRVPGVIFLHGSGPADEDGTVGGVKPLKDVACGLASKGVATLRFKKRTIVDPSIAKNEHLTVKEEVLDDALVALNTLRAAPGVDPARIYVAGHSLGGFLAPEVATLDGKVAGVIVLAGPPKMNGKLVTDQFDYLAKLNKEAGVPDSDAFKGMRASAEKLAAGTYSDTENILGALGWYWRDLFKHDALATVAKLPPTVRIAVVLGGRDYQVPVFLAGQWAEVLKNRPDSGLKRYPKLNHLMVSGEGPGSPSEYAIPAYVDPQVVEDLSTFIQTGKI